MKKIAVALCVCAVLASALVFVPTSPARAQSASEQAEITRLLGIIAQLQQVLAQLLAGNAPVCTQLTRTLYIGLSDAQTAGEVSKLQRYLKTTGDYTYPTITGFFGAATQGAVQRFQDKRGIVHGGTPATTGFGIVGVQTRYLIEALSCGYFGTNQTPTQPAQQTPVPPAEQTPVPPAEQQPLVLKKCANGIDDDGDGKIDYPNDPGCTSASDNNETDSVYKCSDGIDNDGDDVIDYPYEPGCESANDTSEGNDPLLLMQSDYTSSVANIGYNLGGQKTFLVGGDFGNTTTGTVDLEVMRKIIDGEAGYERIPSNFSGYAVLDIEEPYFAWLRESPTSQHFQYAQSEMLRALNYAKQLRPYAKWGYYNIPLFPIHFDGGSWADASDSAKQAELSRVFAPAALLDAVDFYAPSIYSPYPDASTPSYLVAKEKARNKESVRQSIMRSNGKPVFTYISDRFWNSSPVYNYIPMPWDEFRQKQFIGMDYGADGVFLWGGDHYWYNLGYVYDPAILPGYALVSRQQIRAAFDPLLPGDMTGPQYIDAFQEQTLRIVADELYGIDYTPHTIGSTGEQGGDESGGDNSDGGIGGGTTSTPPIDGSSDGRKVSFIPHMFSQLASVFYAVLGFFGLK